MRIILDQSNVTPDALARKSHSIVLRRLQEVGQNTVAERISVSPSTVSRFVSEDLERAMLILGHLGLKVIGKNRVSMKRHVYESMATLVYGVFSDPVGLSRMVLDEEE